MDEPKDMFSLCIISMRKILPNDLGQENYWQYILGVMYPQGKKKIENKRKQFFSNHRIGGSIDTPMTMAAVFQNKAN